MSDDQANTIVHLIRQVKEAIRHAETLHPDKKLSVAKVDLTIKTVLEKKIGADGEIKWLPVPIDLSAHHKESEIQTISLSLVPERGLVLMGTVADELADAIEVIRIGVEEAAASSPVFGLDAASIELNIGTTSDGSIKVIVGGNVATENTHKVKLTLAPA